MSLKPIESKLLNNYFKTGNFSTGHYLYAAGINAAPYARAVGYYDRLDCIICHGEYNQYPSPDREIHYRFDPLGFDNTGPVAAWGDVASGKRANMFCVGEWDRVGNSQIIYCGNNTLNQFFTMDPNTWFVDESTNQWPFLWYTGGGGVGSMGGWDDNGAQGNFVFFETWGYAIRGAARVQHTDTNLYRGLALIDLSTAKATLLDVPTYYTTFPAALFEAPEFNGDSFTLGVPQFVPDDDSLPAAPKGRLFLYQGDYLGDGAVPDSNNRVYFKVVEFNPLGVAPAPGTPNRVHLREILFSRMNFIQQQPFGTNPNSAGDATQGGTPSIYRTKHFYHSPTRTIITFFDWNLLNYENQRGIVRHSIVPEVDSVEPVTPQTEVETNKSVVFLTRALGDIADPVAGVNATWSLARRSTVDEVLDTSGAPVSNVVAHPPMDEGTCVVKYQGTPLTEGVDYSVVEATGTITWMGSHSPPAASGYTASYLHSTVSATPAHGTLLQATSETDEDGFAETRVQYADEDFDDGRERDRLTVTISDD